MWRKFPGLCSHEAHIKTMQIKKKQTCDSFVGSLLLLCCISTCFFLYSWMSLSLNREVLSLCLCISVACYVSVRSTDNSVQHSPHLLTNHKGNFFLSSHDTKPSLSTTAGDFPSRRRQAYRAWVNPLVLICCFSLDHKHPLNQEFTPFNHFHVFIKNVSL